MMKNKEFAPTYRSLSGWNSLLPPRLPKVDLPRERRFRSIIVGGGYTGLAVARRLAQLAPDEEILLIEAAMFGEGASGRNSGYLLVNPGEPSANASDFDADWGVRQMGMAQAGFDMLREAVKTHGIECNWDETSPAITSAATPRVEKAARTTRQTYVNWGLSPKEYEAPELARMIGTDYYRYGFQSLTRALVQPAALHRGLADTLPPSVSVLEKTIVEELSDKSPFHLRTNRGEYVADRVFLANNLHARRFGIVRGRMVGIYTYGAFTPELDADQLELLGDEPSWGVLPAHRMGTTLRKTMGRLLIRSGDSYEGELEPDATKHMLTALYQRRFPQMREHRFEHVWGGATAITHNGGFFFGKVKDGLYASAGCGGAGVVRGTVHGKLLADLAEGFQSSLLSDRLKQKGPNWLPPEPLKGIGAKTQIKWEQWLAGLER